MVMPKISRMESARYDYRAIGTVLGYGEIYIVREECRLAFVYHIFHIFAADGEFARCTYDDAHVGNLIIVEKGFWKRVYNATRAADVLIIGHLLLEYIYAIASVFHCFCLMFVAKLMKKRTCWL